MRVEQFVPSFVPHDAISNHARFLHSALLEAGHSAAIFYEHVDPSLVSQARPYTECDPRPDASRLILYHASTSSSMAAWLVDAARGGQKVALDYHNITPSRYFARWLPSAAFSMDVARGELAGLRTACSLAVAASEYNRSELAELGFEPTAVCPLIVDVASRPVRSRLPSPEGASWLFVGRIAPNKCQHDVIAAFAVYRRLFAPAARLTLVGGVTAERYRLSLEAMAVELEVADAVELTGPVTAESLDAHLGSADVFVCLSEHEGFCAPIVEAMAAGVPVVGFAAAAVPETVAGAGLVLDSKDPLAVAVAVHDLLEDPTEWDRLVKAGLERARRFSRQASAACLVSVLEDLAGERR
jgi:glycosyltransferase involved in cell wall biosynthesis